MAGYWERLAAATISLSMLQVECHVSPDWLLEESIKHCELTKY